MVAVDDEDDLFRVPSQLLLKSAGLLARSTGCAEAFQFACLLSQRVRVANYQEFRPYDIRDPWLLHTLPLPLRDIEYG